MLMRNTSPCTRIICFPRAVENAWVIRSLLFLDGQDNPLNVLCSGGLYPVPNPPQPIIGHEQEGSLWRRRCDVTISLRAVEEIEKKNVGAVRVAPQIKINTWLRYIPLP